MAQYTGATIPDISQWRDMGLAGEVDDYTAGEPEEWRKYGLHDFGLLAESWGIMDGVGLGLAVEATPQLIGGQVVARTPLLELSPTDYQWMKVMRRPYNGMAALGDDGQVYEYDGSLGFFKKLFRRIKRGVKKVAKRIGGAIKKVIRKIPGGKFLIKLGGKLFSVAKKLVGPLMKYVGPLAKKLAPVAALIPGYGPAISAGLLAAGKISDLMKKTGTAIKTIKGVSKIAFRSKNDAISFATQLKKEAFKEAKRLQAGGKPHKLKLPKPKPIRRSMPRGRFPSSLSQRMRSRFSSAARRRW